ncbi:MAG: response regulator, partial [Lachnospiraceae bacterium]|nr:response regulator [Lachnospiraceae bacterium]
KMESGRMEVVKDAYSIRNVTHDVTDMMRMAAEKKGLSLSAEINEKMPDRLYGDERKIRQIITNLLSNAIKYTKEGFVSLEIDFVLKEEKNQQRKEKEAEKAKQNKKAKDGIRNMQENGEIELQIRVKDTGCGIRKEDQDTIFEAFQRADLKSNRSIEGNGLGLAICQNYVKMMQGTIRLESTYGKGCLFIVMLPQQVVSEKWGEGITMEQQKNGGKEDITEASFSGKRILLVDDNDINLLVEATMLRHMGVTVETAGSGSEAMDALRKTKFHLILLDHMMSGLDGIETFRIIRKEGLADGVPIIALTANAIPGAEKQYLKYGFDDYLTKPVSGEDLKRVMNKWIG